MMACSLHNESHGSTTEYNYPLKALEDDFQNWQQSGNFRSKSNSDVIEDDSERGFCPARCMGSEFVGTKISDCVSLYLGVREMEALPEDHMPDFHHYDDARDIWMAIKARFGGNEESKKMKKTMLKQQFTEFSMTEEEGLHKGYDRFQKILSQLNQCAEARPEQMNETNNLKCLRALPTSYGVNAAALPTHSAFIGATQLWLKGLLILSAESQKLKQRTKSFVSVDSKVNWSDQRAEIITGEMLATVFAMMEFLPKAYQNVVKTLQSQKDWYHKTQIALEETIRVLSANLENTPLTLQSYTKNYMNRHKKKRKNGKLRFKDYFGKDEVFDLSGPSTMYPEPVEEEVKPLYSCLDQDQRTSQPAVDIKTLPESDKIKKKKNRSAVNSAGRKPNPTGRVGQAAHLAAAQSNPAGWSKRPAPVSAGRPVSAGWSKRPTPVSAGRPVSAGWHNPAARPYFRPSSVYFNNWPELYDPMYMNEGRWGTAGDPSSDNDIGKGGSSNLEHFNLFSVSQICDKKNKVLFTDTDCLVLTEEFQLPDESQVQKHPWMNPPDGTEGWLHVNFQNKSTTLAKEGLVDGLPLKVFTNEHNCVACNKGKQHKASYKHISASSRNARLIELCGEKGIKRDYSNPRTPQQNGVAERKNRTLIEAARTMLADSKLPTMFWTEAVSTACYELVHEWYFDLDYLTDSLGYTHFKTNKLAGTQETNINAATTQDHDSDSRMDEQVIVALHDMVLFSQETAEILSQAEAEIRNQGVSADRDPAGIDSAGGVSASSASAGSDSAGGNPAGSFPPAISYEPAGQAIPAVQYISPLPEIARIKLSSLASSHLPL
ncbi:ribonuclease H-like domain-containing protein [Tanacetum coccineum]